MKRALFSLAIVAVIAAAVAAYTLPFYPQYWIKGTAQDSSDGVSVDGHHVVFFRTVAEAESGSYAYDTIGPTGVAAAGKQYLLNTYGLSFNELTVGGTYFLAIPNDNPANPAEGYGADPVAVTITGAGLDIVAGTLVLEKGKGLSIVIGGGPVGPVNEPPPTIKLWFGNRLYQSKLVESGQTFVIAEKPVIKVTADIADPYTLAGDISGYSIVVDPDSSSARILDLSATPMSSKVYASGTEASENKLKMMSLEYSVTEALPDGEHRIAITARSSGAMGTAGIATYNATVEVMGGPVRLIGIPICFPSPFSITKQHTVTIQYTLSKDALVEIIFADISGQRVKNFICEAGSEGGSAGLNKVTWDGRTDRGLLAGNGIYVGLIVAREDSRKLGSVKLTVVD